MTPGDSVLLAQLAPLIDHPILWRDSLEAIKVIGPTVGAMAGTALMVKKLWNGNNEHMADIRNELRANSASAGAAREAISSKIDTFTSESRADRVRLHESITGLVDRTAKIEGSCVLHQRSLLAAVNHIPDALTPVPKKRTRNPKP